MQRLSPRGDGDWGRCEGERRVICSLTAAERMSTLNYSCADGRCLGYELRAMRQSTLQDRRLGLVTAGVEFAVLVGVLTGGGYWLDRHTGLLPLGTLVGLAAGFSAALYRLIRQARGAGGGTCRVGERGPKP